MAALTVFAADSLTGFRSMRARVLKHPAMTTWFILLMMAATWMGLRIADVIVSNDLEGELAIRPETILLVFFLIMMGKSAVDTNQRVTQNKQMMMILSQPVGVYEALWGKFAYIVLGNLAVLSVILGTATVGHALFTPDLLVPLWFIACFIPLTILASAMGFSFSIMTSQPVMWRRLVGVAMLAQLASAIYLSFDILGRDPGYLVPASMFILAVALACIPVASRYFLAAWNYEVSGAEGILQKAGRAGSGKLFASLTRWMEPSTRELFRKEMVINISRKEVGGTLFTILGLGVVLVYLRTRMGSQVALATPFFSIVLPLLVCIGLYIAAVLQYAMLGLGSLGKEGGNFWILKHLPVNSERIFQAKAGALLAFTPVIVLAISVPVPILSGMGLDWVIFFILAGLALAFAYTAVGIWSGTVYPNFDEGTRGAPDVMTMYLIMMACLVLGAVVVGIPGLVMKYDPLVGILAMALSADWAALFLVQAVKRSARNYDRMEAGL
jgi:hypothetical protein